MPHPGNATAVLWRWPQLLPGVGDHEVAGSPLVLIGSVVIGAIFFIRGCGATPRWRASSPPSRFGPAISNF